MSVIAGDDVDEALGLIADFNAVFRLFRRHYRGVEDMNETVGAVAKPDLFLVRGQADAVAGAPVPLHFTLFIAFDLYAI